MRKYNPSEDVDINRRKVLKATSAAAMTGMGIAATASSASAGETSKNGQVVPVNGRKEDEYIKEAISHIAESDNYAPLRERLSKREYKITAEDAMVTKGVAGGSEKTVTVFLPLLESSSNQSLGTIPKRKNSDPEMENIEFGHVVWKNTEPSDGFAIVSGDAEKVTNGIDIISEQDVPSSSLGTEVIETDRHDIELSSQIGGKPEQGAIKPSDTNSTPFVTTVDVDTETVNRINGLGTEIVGSSVTPAATSCPDSIPVILGAIAGCGSSCSACASLSIGNPTAIFGCIGCASCGCGLGCCLGERSSTLCKAASSYISLPGFIASPGTTAGAICVNEGCNDKTCF